MIFKKRTRSDSKKYSFPGTIKAMDGRSAVVQVETLACDALCRQSPDTSYAYFPDEASVEELNNYARPLIFHKTGNMNTLAGLPAGFALTGLRAAIMVEGESLASMHTSLFKAVGNRLTYVVNLFCRSAERQAASAQGAHDDFHAVSDSGFFQLFARNVQEAADFPLIAHRIAELALNPGICALDGDVTGSAIQTIHLPEEELIKVYLGLPGDLIECPTPAQKILFGEKRKRVPELFDIDRPLGVGVIQDSDSFFKALVAQHSFFSDHIAGFIDQAMREFGELTGRFYDRASGYYLDDAEYVVVAQGALVEELRVVVDYLRRHKKVKAGVLNLTLFRPFPGDRVSRFLKGKRAVTVLERLEQPLAEDPPLLKEVRCAMDKSMENGIRSKDSLPYPSYAIYKKVSDRPQLFSGIYGGRRIPSFSELVTVFQNMLPAGTQKRFYYVGIPLKKPDTRFPKLETLQHSINKAYPHLMKLFLLDNEIAGAPLLPRHVFQIQSLPGGGDPLYGGLLANAFFEAMGWWIQAFPEEYTSERLRRAVYTIVHEVEAKSIQEVPAGVEAIIVSHEKLLNESTLLASLQTDGILVIHSAREPRALWSALSEKCRRQIRQHTIHMYYLDAYQIACEVATEPHFRESLAMQALIGAFLKALPYIKKTDLQRIRECYRKQLEGLFGGDHFLVDECMSALMRGGQSVRELKWQSLPAVTAPPVPEPEAPWAVRQVKHPDGTLFDLARFWDSVGFMYNTGQADQTLVDPFVATGMVPARSAAFHDSSVSRSQLPRILPENCTGCGLCWAYCPDSAMPPTIQDLESLITAAMQQCSRDGQSMIQLQRILQPLVKQAYKLILQDELHQYRYLDALLEKAFSRLVERVKPREEQLLELQAEFEQLHQTVKSFPIIRTETFFEVPQKKEKGSGLLLSIVIDPQSCQGCGLCMKVCPEEAIEMVDQTAALMRTYHTSQEFLRCLPEVSPARITRFVSEDRWQTLLYHLLNQKVYYSLVGGDMASPGSGVKSAVHLLVAAAEAVMQPRVKSLLDKLSGLIDQIAEKIQGEITNSLRINDLERFGQELSRIESEGLTLKALAQLINEQEGEREVDKKRLQRLTALHSRLKDLQQLYLEGANGNGRARLAMTMGTGRFSNLRGLYPYNPYSFPWVHRRGHEASAVAEGVFEGIMRKMAETFKTIRMAELELQDLYVPAEHDSFFRRFSWQDLNEEEWALCPPVVILDAEEAANGENLDGILRLLLSNLPIKIVILDSLSNAVAGGQSGAASFKGQGNEHKTGIRFKRKEPGLIALSHRNVFVLQTTLGNPGHFLKGVMEGFSVRGPALFHIYAPEPSRDGILPYQVIEQAALAIESRAFPLLKYNPEIATDFLSCLSLEGNPDPEADWAAHVWRVRDDSGVESEIRLPVTFAGWAVREGRFMKYFKFLPRREWHRNMVLLSDYIALDPSQREGLEPYVQFQSAENKMVRMLVSREMIMSTEERLQFWRLLQELAGIRSPQGEYFARKTKEELEREKAELAAKYEARIAELEKDSIRVYHTRLTQKLLSLSNLGRDAEKLRMTLREFIKRGRNNESE